MDHAGSIVNEFALGKEYLSCGVGHCSDSAMATISGKGQGLGGSDPRDAVISIKGGHADEDTTGESGVPHEDDAGFASLLGRAPKVPFLGKARKWLFGTPSPYERMMYRTYKTAVAVKALDKCLRRLGGDDDVSRP